MFGGFLRVDRRAVLGTSPYAYQKASWLVPADTDGRVFTLPSTLNSMLEVAPILGLIGPGPSGKQEG